MLLLANHRLYKLTISSTTDRKIKLQSNSTCWNPAAKFIYTNILIVPRNVTWDFAVGTFLPLTFVSRRKMIFIVDISLSYKLELPPCFATNAAVSVDRVDKAVGNSWRCRRGLFLGRATANCTDQLS
jgi:hypothetical protein